MAVWRCPHCATPQPEASRCWVCRRSTTCCATCRHFRRGVAGGLGVCGLDPRHPVLTGTEMQPCWAAAPPPPEPEDRPVRARGPVPVTWIDGLVAPAPRTFVPVEPSVPVVAATPGGAGAAVLVGEAVEVASPGSEPMAAPVEPAAEPLPAVSQAPTPRPVPGRWWLWGDPDPWPEP